MLHLFENQKVILLSICVIRVFSRDPVLGDGDGLAGVSGLGWWGAASEDRSSVLSTFRHEACASHLFPIGALAVVSLSLSQPWFGPFHCADTIIQEVNREFVTLTSFLNGCC